MKSAPAVLLAIACAPCLAQQSSPQPSGPQELDHITVTGTAARRVDGVPASVTVITRKELQQRPALDLADAVQGTPGLNLMAIGMGRRGISVRGMDPGYTMTLVDGLRVNSSANSMAHSDFDFGWVPVEAMERIEIVRGPMSSLYGSEALGGVINVVTRSATDRWAGSASFNLGRRDEAAGGAWWQVAGYAGGPLVRDRLGFSVFGERRHQDKTGNPFSPGTSLFEGRDARDVSVKLSWTPNTRQRVDLRYLTGHERRDRDVLQTGKPSYTYQTVDDLDRRLWALSHSGTWGWGESRFSVLKANLSKSNWRSRGAAQGLQEAEDLIINGQVTIPRGERQRWVVGGEWRQEVIDDPLANRSGHVGAVHRALFAQGEFQLGEHTSLVAGDRYDRHVVFGGHHSPRLYLVHERPDGWTFKGGYGSGFKAPTLKQLSPDYEATVAGLFRLVGNPALRPEINRTLELSAARSTAQWRLEATVFRNALQDLIQSVCTAQCGRPGVLEQRTYSNVERANVTGIELGGHLQLAQAWRVEGNYTWLDTHDLANDRPLRLRPRHQANLGLRWMPNAEWMLRLRSDYLAGQIDYPSRGPEVHLPATWSHSFDAQWRPVPAVALRAGIDNLTNSRQNTALFTYPYPLPGRGWHAGVQVSF